MRKIVVFAILLVLISSAYADMTGIEYPAIRFNVKLDGTDVKDEVFYYSVLSCYRSPGSSDVVLSKSFTEYDYSRQCTWGVPYTEMMILAGNVRSYSSEEFEVGDLTGECRGSACTGKIILPLNGFRVAFYLPSENKNFVTNVARCAGCDVEIHKSWEKLIKEGLDEEYDVSLFSNGTAVIRAGREIPPSPSQWFLDTFHFSFGFLLTLISWTLVIELIVSFIYLHLGKLSKRILVSAAIANIVSVTLLTMLLYRNPYATMYSLIYYSSVNWFLSLWPVVILELLVVIFESAVIFLMNRKRISTRDAFAMSLVSNAASFLVGIIFAPAISRSLLL